MGRLLGKTCSKYEKMLKKSLGKSKLNYAELLTIVTEIEAVLNSRPLCYTYDNSIDEAITPSHLIFGRKLLSTLRDDLEPENVDFPPVTLTKRTKHINNLLSNFWNS